MFNAREISLFSACIKPSHILPIDDTKINKELEKSIDSLETIEDLTTSEAVKLGEDEEEEPTSSQLKGASKDSIAVLARKLQQVSSELKTTANKWKKTEGGEKEELKNRLLTLTKIKKELESML